MQEDIDRHDFITEEPARDETYRQALLVDYREGQALGATEVTVTKPYGMVRTSITYPLEEAIAALESIRPDNG